MENSVILIIFGGLPGTGKTTLARALAEQLGAVFLRIDTIEQALRQSQAFAGSVDDAGYRVVNHRRSPALWTTRAIASRTRSPRTTCDSVALWLQTP